MGTFLKFKDAGLAAYNNAEYINFLNRFRELLPFAQGEEDRPGSLSLQKATAQAVPALGISAEQVEQLDDYIARMTELNNQSRISQETAQRTELDHQRDSVATYLLNRISTAAASPMEEERKAGVYLANVVKPYSGITRLAMNQETETVKGLLVDLRKETSSASVASLSLTPCMEELERLNNRFAELTSQRFTVKANNSTLENSKTVRPKANALYEDMTDLAFASSLLNPSEEATLFIRNVNTLIDEFQTALHFRKSQTKDKDKDKEEGGGSAPDDRPGELR